MASPFVCLKYDFLKEEKRGRRQLLSGFKLLSQHLFKGLDSRSGGWIMSLLK